MRFGQLHHRSLGHVKLPFSPLWTTAPGPRGETCGVRHVATINSRQSDFTTSRVRRVWPAGTPLSSKPWRTMMGQPGSKTSPEKRWSRPSSMKDLVIGSGAPHSEGCILSTGLFAIHCTACTYLQSYSGCLLGREHAACCMSR